LRSHAQVTEVRVRAAVDPVWAEVRNDLLLFSEEVREAATRIDSLTEQVATLEEAPPFDWVTEKMQSTADLAYVQRNLDKAYDLMAEQRGLITRLTEQVRAEHEAWQTQQAQADEFRLQVAAAERVVDLGARGWTVALSAKVVTEDDPILIEYRKALSTYSEKEGGK
jgi:hypothetical protein